MRWEDGFILLILCLAVRGFGRRSWRFLSLSKNTYIISTVTCVLALNPAMLVRCGDIQASGIDKALQLRFINGIANSKEKIENTPLKAKCDASVIYIDGKVEAVESQRSYQSVVLGPFVKNINLARRSGGIDIFAQNDEYAFAVSKKPNLDRYSLTFVGELGNLSDKISEQKQYHELTVYDSVLGCWHCYGHFLWDWPEQEGFEWKSVSESQVDGREIVRVEFEYTPSASGPSLLSRSMMDAYFECVPENGWALREAGFRMDNGTRIRNVVTLQNKTEYDIALAKHVTQETISEEDIAFIRSSVDVEILDGSDITEEEFYLSHYGLPEPKFESSFPTWLTYALAGLACLAVVYFWRRRSAMRE